MLILEELKKMGVEATPEMQSKFGGDWLSAGEVDRKEKQLERLKQEKQELEKRSGELEQELAGLKDSADDAQTLKDKVAELTQTLETERSERAAKDEADRLSAQVSEFFGDKHFVNDITADAIKSTLVSELQKDTAKGRSISDIFDSIVKDEKGEYKPNILISEKDIEAQKNRSQIIGAGLHGQQGNGSLSIAELMRQKNQNPDMDITPYLKQK